ncbi:MAG TPA: pilus assembly protein TadG-related protein [Rhizomicrobium sp.]|jgi:Flp pilus assembly protein TadG|nr:pilus assembly protein TadG-related protein [Rhizomicrobium sp.]
MPIVRKIRVIAALAAAFRRSTRANVAMIFGLSLVPLTVAAGTGLDLARGMLVHEELLTSLDAAALAVGGTPGLSQTQMTALAQQYFNANYKADSSYGTPTAVSVVTAGQTIKVSASVPMPTTLMSVVGYRTYTVNASSTVMWGQQKLWVSLVLDNTGSMTQADPKTGTTKMTALRSATHSLLNLLQSVAMNPGDVQVSITPFARDVKIGTTYASQNWLSWTDFLAAPTTAPSTSIGPGSTCPFTDSNDGFHCQTTPTNGSSTATKIPSTGTYKGYICPSDNTVGHYYNGCWTSTANGTKFTHTWVANAKSTWSGCVTDRAQNYDADNTIPTTTNSSTLMVAENSPSCVQAPLLALGYNWTSLSSEVDTMVAAGSTNQTVGMVWGWQTQSQNVPFSATALPANTQRIMILLSDGLNTQDRWYGDGSNQSTQVDARMALACTNAKTYGFTVYTVFVDLNGTQGNSTVLQNCASDSTKYFDLTSADQIVSTFNQIGEQITNLRVSQ